MKKLFLTSLAVLTLCLSATADEGMWLPSLIGRQIPDMKAKGFRLSTEDIYSINQASLKDAVVLFAGGCTAELVSPEGLLLTNHHCGYDFIQRHSSLEHDYLTDGFWAMNREEELPNPGLSVMFLVRMDDVTDRVLDGTLGEGDDAARAARIAANIEKVKGDALAAFGDEPGYRASVEAMYYGNQYFLFVYREYTDVRLVGTPPSSIGKFGGDTDNWIWPRHTGDFSVFRIYADADNRPADYSPENVPYRPARHFTVSTKGVKEGDFTFVYGFPGTTFEYVLSDYVDYTLNYSNPHKIRLRTERLDIINAAMDADPAVRIMYSSKAADIANPWKKWQGQSWGLERRGTIDKKRAYEERFREWARGTRYEGVTEELHDVYARWIPYAQAADLYRESVMSIELFSIASKALAAASRGEVPDVEKFYKDYSPAIDCRVAHTMMAEFFANVPERFRPDDLGGIAASPEAMARYVDSVFDNSALVTREGFEALASGGAEEFAARLAGDPAAGMAMMFSRAYAEKVSPGYGELNLRISSLYPVYMRGMMEMEPDRNFYPDANLTLRVAYGAVEGYSPADGERHLPMTTIEGIMQKDNPDIYDYDVPARMRELYRTKGYGRWGINVGTRREPRMTVPVAFIASNHTTGGNSGSPVLNARGELIGINFDRTWLATMSDIEYDPEICRNIIVDIRYVLFVMDRIGGAGYLIDEMTLK